MKFVIDKEREEVYCVGSMAEYGIGYGFTFDETIYKKRMAEDEKIKRCYARKGRLPRSIPKSQIEEISESTLFLRK